MVEEGNKRNMKEEKERKKLFKNATVKDIEMLKQRKFLAEKYAGDEDAAKCVALNDQAYGQWLGAVNNLYVNLHNCYMVKNRIDRNMKEILAGDIKSKHKDGTVMTDLELETENMRSWNMIYQNLEGMWSIIPKLYIYTEVTRIDGEVFFTEEKYKNLVQEIKDKLKKVGLKLYQTRI